MKIIVLGATGLVGQQIVQKCLERNDVKRIILFVRRKSQFNDPRIEEHIVDFDHIEKWRELITGDILFSTLGTTLKVAGSKEAQFKIDYTYQLEVARNAAMNKVSSYVLISSVNADPNSAFFYLKMKGKLEKAVSDLAFQSISLLRPGPLKGSREVPRLNEIISTKILDFIPNAFISPGLKPVSASAVAEVALEYGFAAHKGVKVVGPEMIITAPR